MKKKLLLSSLIICIGVLLFGIINASAETVTSGSCGENVLWNLDEDGTLTISGSGDMYSFESISNAPWYYQRLSIKSVIIENEITSIGDYVFSNFENLETVELCDSIKSIGDSAFGYCTKLKSIHLPDDITTIGDYAFYSCRSMEDISIPKSTTSIGQWAYACGSGKLPSTVIIPENVTYIGDYAFANYTTMTKLIWNAKNVTNLSATSYLFYNSGRDKIDVDVIFGSNVEIIPDHALNSSTNIPKIKTVTIGKNVKSIGNRAFYGYNRIDGVYYFGTEKEWNELPKGSFNEGLTSAKIHFAGSLVASGNCGETLTWALYDSGVLLISGLKNMYSWGNISDVPWSNYKESIKSVLVENGVTSIGNNAFYNCANLESISLFEGMTEIGERAFYNCTSLKCITIPKSVTTVGTQVLYNCKNLTDIYWNAENASILDAFGNTFGNAGINGEGIHLLFGNRVKHIPAYLTNSSCNIKTITIGENVSTIGICALAFCKNLTKINWNAENVQDFSGNRSVFCSSGANQGGIDVVFGDNVTRIPALLFSDTPSDMVNIKSVTLGNNVETIGTRAFSGCKNLTKINFPDNLTYIGYHAFDSCSGLTHICIPVNLEGMDSGVFSNCNNLIKVDWYAKNLTGITGQGSPFYKCGVDSDGIDFVFHDSVENIPKFLFSGASDTESPNIKTVTIYDGVADVGEYAFRYASSLETTYYMGTPNQWASVIIRKGNDFLLNNVVFVKHTQTNISDDGKTFVIDPVNIDEGKTVIVALYKGGQFVEAQSAVYKSETLTFTTTKEYDTVKIMVWEDLTDLSPVTEPEII